MSLKARTTFYSLILAFGVCETCFGFSSSFLDGFSPYLYIFGKIAGAAATLTWIWMSVLLSYNNRPRSTHSLARSRTHFISLVTFTIAWLGIGSMVASQLPEECDFITASDGLARTWCSMAATTSGLAYLISIFAAVSATYVYRNAQISGAGLAVNVAQADKIGMQMLPVV